MTVKFLNNKYVYDLRLWLAIISKDICFDVHKLIDMDSGVLIKRVVYGCLKQNIVTYYAPLKIINY